MAYSPALIILIAGLLVGGIVIGVLICLRVMGMLRRREGKVNQRRGRHAEKDALELLRSEGFRILEVEPHIRCELLVNGDLEEFDITPDALVEKDGQEFLVEVKRYTEHASIANASIRRQVLEYLYSTELPCLLVRMPEGDIDMIELPDSQS